MSVVGNCGQAQSEKKPVEFQGWEVQLLQMTGKEVENHERITKEWCRVWYGQVAWTNALSS